MREAFDFDDVRIVPECIADGMFEFGSVEQTSVRDKAHGNPESYLVSFGSECMVLSWALPILYLATDFRFSARRLWQLVLDIGHCPPHNHYVLPGIDYGTVEEGINQFLFPLPNWISKEDLTERLGELERDPTTVEEVKQVLVHEGGFWAWMAGDKSVPSVLDLPSRGWTDLTASWVTRRFAKVSSLAKNQPNIDRVGLPSTE